MIVFDLKCGGGHVFEAWFGSTGAYEDQRMKGQICCPLCSRSDIGKALMAPAIASKGNRMPEAPAPDAIKAVMKLIAARQAGLLKSSRWVGPAFAERARAIHSGEEKQAIIHGQASLAEAKALVEEGISVIPLPLPIAPPEKLN